MKAAKILIECLKEAGVQYIFSIPGGHIETIFDTLYENKAIKLISVRHEQAAAHMADGYARATGRLGICLGTAGPGATNLVTGVTEAWVSSSPLLVLTGNIRTKDFGKGDLQEFDTLPVFNSITKKSVRVSHPERMADVIKDAIRVATTGRKGPVHCEIPRDILEGEADFDGFTLSSFDPPTGNPRAIEEVARMLTLAKNPLIYVGGGVKWSQAGEDVLRLARLLGCPVVTSFMGKGAVPEGNPLVLGLALRKFLMLPQDVNDLMLAIGCRFSGPSTMKWSIKFPPDIVHIDIDSKEIGKNYPVRIGIIGDAKESLLSLIKEVKRMVSSKEREARIGKIDVMRKNLWGLGGESGEVPAPQRLIEEIRHFLKDDAIVVTDAGKHQAWCLQYFMTKNGGDFLTPLGFGTMGFGFPAALGVKLAHPEKEVLCITGDGGFAMMDQEMETAKRYGINVVVAILNNRGTGAIRQSQMSRFSGRYIGVDYEDINFAKVAQGFGIYGERIENIGKIYDALDRAFAAGLPAILDIVFDDRSELAPI
ncbi:MAG: thiamine pyrophosphate-binding protein [Deltaproteobacteria bacterium]|nr:thiamine pyrophosphate-binding protein [Deltaproteobacteria bacterium]